MRDVCRCGHLEQTHRAGCSSPTCTCAAFECEDAPVQETIPDVLPWLLSPVVPVAGVPVTPEPENGLERVAAVAA